MCVLLRVDVTDEDTPYVRSDICEVEPEIVLGLLRILVHFVRQLEKQVESLQTISITEQAQATFLHRRSSLKNTLESVSSQLLPWTLTIIEGAFFTDEKLIVRSPPRMLINALDQKVKNFVIAISLC